MLYNITNAVKHKFCLFNKCYLNIFRFNKCYYRKIDFKTNDAKTNYI